MVEPTIVLMREASDWVWTAWEPGTAATHAIVSGELGRIDSRRLLDRPTDVIALVGAALEYEVACRRAAYEAILARVPEAAEAWKSCGVIRTSVDPALIRARLDHRARMRARGSTNVGETTAAAPTFAGTGEES